MLLRSPRHLFFVVLSIPALFLLSLFLFSRLTDPIHVNVYELPDEIFGLLHFVTSPDEAGRIITAPGNPAHDSPSDMTVNDVVTPDKPVEMAWYALGSITKAGYRTRPGSLASGWDDRLRVLHDDYPLVVFSKTYCPYSKRAKKLLGAYDLSPAPKIIEVDLRADSAHLKTLLTRLTHQTTFPNVILHGRSLGGSDDLVRLHDEDQLREVFEAAGLRVRGDRV